MARFLSFLALATSFHLTGGELKDNIQGAAECTISFLNADGVYAAVGNGKNNTCSSDEDDGVIISEASFTDISSPAPNTIGELGEDIGVPQMVDPNQAQATLDLIEQARQYMKKEVMIEAKYEPVRDLCKNNHKSCTFWSLIGECEVNPAYMKVNCGPACFSCEVSIDDRQSPIVLALCTFLVAASNII
jgi:hypothetical protein